MVDRRRYKGYKDLLEAEKPEEEPVFLSERPFSPLDVTKSKPTLLTKVETFRRILSEAIEYGYDVLLETSLDFSPVDILLDCAVDLVLLLRRTFQIGAFARQKNPEVRFTEDLDLTDRNAPWLDSVEFHERHINPAMALHTMKSIKFRQPSNYYWDPTADEYFTALAQTFIEIKNSKPVKTSFHEMFEQMGFKKTSRISNIRGYHNKAKARYQWWRRRERRLRRSKTRNQKP